jgi:deazaflavin-dependent oxidoreductase (nitroreductase family)
MWFNTLIRFILRSPLHPWMSASTMLVTWTGHKSGNTYSTPVNYQRQGEQLVTTSTRKRTWWRSLRSGNAVTLLLQGKSKQATARVLENDEAVTPALQTFLENDPRLLNVFNVTLDENKKPRLEDVAKEASKRVIIYFSVED